MPRMFLSNIQNLTTVAQKESAYKNLVRNKALMNTPDGKKAASMLEEALGLPRTFPDMDTAPKPVEAPPAPVVAEPAPVVAEPAPPSVEPAAAPDRSTATSNLTRDQLLVLASEWKIEVPADADKDAIIALLKAAI